MRLLVTGDWHLRKNRPRCRLDEDWKATQKKHLSQIAYESSSRKCPVLITGDIFNSAIVAEEIVNLFLEFCQLMNNDVLFIAGNHDLPDHSMNNVYRSSIGILFNVMALGTTKLVSLDKYRKEVSYAHFGTAVVNHGKEILVLHRLTYPSLKAIPPNAKASTPAELLEEFPGYNYIFTGDCHMPFHYEKKGRHVVNPGHLNRQKTDETDQPCMYFVDTDTDEIECIEIEDDIDLVTDEYIKNEEDREDRIEAFVEKIKTQKKVSLSFEDNIESALLQNTVTLDETTIKLIRFLMEESDDQFRI